MKNLKDICGRSTLIGKSMSADCMNGVLKTTFEVWYEKDRIFNALSKSIAV